MPTLSRKLKVAEVYAEWHRIEDALRPIGVPVDQICFLEEAIDSLAYGMVERARTLGIEAHLAAMQPVEIADWICEPFEVDVSFLCPDETHAVLFRTMVL